MVVIYYQTDSVIQSETLNKKNIYLLDKAVWIDMLCPTKEEEYLVETQLKIEIPTKAEVEEIEPSSRLYIENTVLYMTVTMIAQSDLPEVKTDVVTYILAEKVLITLRYIELHAFKLFTGKLLTSNKKNFNPMPILINLLETVIERLADILEKISHKHDEISKVIFHQNKEDKKTTDYEIVLRNIGTNGDLGTKVSECLLTFVRLISYLEQTIKSGVTKETLIPLKIIKNDIHALQEHANFLSVKFNFLLDATLGMISIEQNNIIKIFSVAAVIFLPPTLIASIYGMNFRHIPELNWHIGYPFAVFMMLLSAWLPFSYFKRKKWL